MRQLAIAGILLASCTLAAAQENGAGTTTQSTGTGFSRKTSSAAKKVEPPSTVDTVASRCAREEAVLNRRNEVILKLREIALRAGDDALLKTADELQDRAWDLYQQKTVGIQEVQR